MVDLLGPGQGIALQRLAGGMEMQPVAPPAGQPLAPGHEHRGTGFREAGGEGHGVGGPAEEIEPGALTHLGGLVGQHPHGLPLLQGLDQGPYTGEIRRGQMQLRPLAPGQDHALQAFLPGRPVEHGDRTEGRVVLGGDLETAQMRRQEQDAPAGRLGRPHMLPAPDLGHLGIGLFQAPHPDARQLQGLLAGLPGCRQTPFRPESRLGQVGLKMAPVTWRNLVNQPAGQSTKTVHPDQGQMAEQTEEKDHGVRGLDKKGKRVRIIGSPS